MDITSLLKKMQSIQEKADLAEKAAAALQCTSSRRSPSFLLNWLAIGFASNVDDLLVFFFVKETERKKIEEEMEEIMLRHEGRSAWTSNRVYGGVLVATLVVTEIYCCLVH